MNRILATATLLALSGAWTAAAHADNEKGFYAGGGIGRFNAQIDDVDQTEDVIQSFDDDDAAWKLFAGYRFNPYISVEAAYVDFGDPSDEFDAEGSSGDYSVSLSGFAPYVIGTLPLGPVELFAKVGYYFYDVDVSFDFDELDEDIVDSEDSDQDFLYGVGVGATFFEHLHARLEYEKIDSSELDDADALWLSAAWRF